MIFTLFFILLVYIGSLIMLFIGNRKIPLTVLPESEPVVRFSILIPFRNEEKNLPSLLTGLDGIIYPPDFFEVIFINDASEDASVEIIRQHAFRNPNVKLVQNIRKSPAPKKDALETGISEAKHPWIVTTDADCLLPSLWLQTLNEFILAKNPEMVCGPLTYRIKNNFLHEFQLAENLMLQFVTKGAFGLRRPIMCNGGNLAYRKESFFEVDGFRGNESIASGDDIFLMEKFRKHEKSILFLNSQKALVETQPLESLQEILNQRVRWASKTSKQNNVFAMTLGIIVAAANLGFIFSLPAPLFLPGGIFFMIYIILKILVEGFLLFYIAAFLKKKIRLHLFLLAALINPFLFIIILYKSLYGNYSWKKRKFSLKNS
ncbi:MAG TPA: glycosyltransferase [Flavobacteriaceae bacterium]|nr:glycosyltransferase [Flavobacteriaceae bacterium]